MAGMTSARCAASGSVAKDTVREMYRIGVTRRGHRVMLLVHGNGFLYNMVRILAGTLIEVGAGKTRAGRNRACAGIWQSAGFGHNRAAAGTYTAARILWR